MMILMVILIPKILIAAAVDNAHQALAVILPRLVIAAPELMATAARPSLVPITVLQVHLIVPEIA